jgi:CBS domain containing-hemolysin-like protein
VETGDSLTVGSIALRLGIVFLLLFANGFFVAAEFALVGARPSKIDAMIARGDSRGDIADEYDVQARRSIETEGVLELVGAVSVVDVRSDYGVKIPEGSWSTLGGYVFSQIGRVAAVGDRVQFPGGELEVVAMDGRRVAAVRVHRARADAKL